MTMKTKIGKSEAGAKASAGEKKEPITGKIELVGFVDDHNGTKDQRAVAVMEDGTVYVLPEWVWDCEKERRLYVHLDWEDEGGEMDCVLLNGKKAYYDNARETFVVMDDNWSIIDESEHISEYGHTGIISVQDVLEYYYDEVEEYNGDTRW